MAKLIEVQATNEFARTFLADPILKIAVNAVLNNAPGFDLVYCRECKKEWCYLRQQLGEDGFCSAGERKDSVQS